MALLGSQFVIMVCVALFLQKLSSFYSLAKWIMCTRLYRYLHPTDEQLRQLAGKPAANKGGRRRGKGENKEQQSHVFTVPRSLEISLEREEIQEHSLYSQYKYQDLKWLVDFSACAALVYVLIEVVGLWRPQVYYEEFNVGFIWCLMVAMFCVKELLMLTAAYWNSDDGGERSMTLLFALFFFVMAMGVLVVKERVLDFGLEAGYEDFTSTLETVFTRMNFSMRRAPAFWVFKIALAFFSAFMGAVLGFPGIRLANMQMEALSESERSVASVFLTTSFVSPVFLSLLWVLPLSRDLLQKGSLISDDTFEYLRIHLVIVVCVFRLFALRKLLQAYLNCARKRLAVLNKEAGRISNRELQRTVWRVFLYLSAAALQYVAPILLSLFLSMMMRTLKYNMGSAEALAHNLPPDDTLMPAKASEYSRLIRGLFSTKLAYGVCSYTLWWTLTAHFLTSCFGTVYLNCLHENTA